MCMFAHQQMFLPVPTAIGKETRRRTEAAKPVRKSVTNSSRYLPHFFAELVLLNLLFAELILSRWFQNCAVSEVFLGKPVAGVFLFLSQTDENMLAFFFL